MNSPETITLENDLIRLEPLSEIHFNELLAISLKNPDLLKFSPSPFGSEESLKNNFYQALQAQKDGLRYTFCIYDKSEARYIGCSSFGNISTENQRLEIGWTWIDKKSQGRGLNQHCKYLLLSYAFDELEIERVEFRTDSRNVQSRKALEKIGGVYEGTLRSHTLMLDGYRRDTAYYSILKSDWTRLKNEKFASFKIERRI
jgi:RimJ/RimL family protein N-acetyltransferase